MLRKKNGWVKRLISREVSCDGGTMTERKGDAFSFFLVPCFPSTVVFSAFLFS